MGSSSSENYLDQLLNSVNKAKKKTQEEKEYEAMIQHFIQKGDEEDDFEYRRAVRERVLEQQLIAKKEEAFIKEFEDELIDGEYHDMLDHFEDVFEEEESDVPEDNFYKEDSTDDAAFYRGFENSDAKNSVFEEAQHEEPLHEEPVHEELLQEEPVESMEDMLQKVAANLSGDSASEAQDVMDFLAGDDSFGEPDLGMPTEEPNLSDDEINLSGEEDDLLSLLAGSEEFSDLGDMLSGEGGGGVSEGTDVFAAFANSELEKQEEEQKEALAPTTKKKKGFFANLMEKLFGKDEEEVNLHQKQPIDAEALSNENDMILMGFDESADSAGGSSKSDAKKGKKDKKEKKAKEPKAKKEPKPKKPKKPKEKKPKKIDNTPPLPKGPVALIFVMATSLLLLIILGTNLTSYSATIKEAKASFDAGCYAEAYEMLVGLEIKEKDLKTYNQLSVLAAPDGELNAYEIFSKANEQTRALDSLISAAGRCEVNAEKAQTFECEGYLNAIKTKVTNELKETYGMTYEQAIEMYEIHKRDDYTLALYAKLEELGLK